MSQGPATALPTPRYANYVLAVMVVMYTFNYLDRFVLTILLSNIKQDLVLSDAMLGFLVGPAFAFFYTLCGIPIARWADVGSRRFIIALGMTIWSGFTAASGLVTNSMQLAIARVCVVRDKVVSTNSPGSPSATGSPLSGSTISARKLGSWTCRRPGMWGLAKLTGPTSVIPW